MLARCLFAASITLPLVGCGRTTPVDPEELEIARAVIATWQFGDESGFGQVVHEDLQFDPIRGDADAVLDSMRVQAAEYDDRLVEAVDDLRAKMRVRGSARALGFDDREVVFITDAELEALFRPRQPKDEDGWSLFNERYPNGTGVGRLSRVGLSRDRTLAIIAQANQSHWLTGQGSMLVFELVQGRWKKLDWRIGPRWVS